MSMFTRGSLNFNIINKFMKFGFGARPRVGCTTMSAFSSAWNTTALLHSPARIVTDRHLETGDPLPALSDGSSVRLFSMRLSPYSQRVRMVLCAKGINYDEINCNLKKKPEFLVERNPIGKVPVLELNGHVITDSSVICELLEELYPDPPLYPKDPFAKAKDRTVVASYSSRTWIAMMTAMSSAGEDKKAVGRVIDGLAAFEKELIKRGTPFFGGQEPGMVDFMVWPFNERFMLSDQLYEVVKSRMPSLVDYFKRMASTPAAQATVNSRDHHFKFLMGRLTKNYVYDFPDSSGSTSSKL